MRSNIRRTALGAAFICAFLMPGLVDAGGMQSSGQEGKSRASRDGERRMSSDGDMRSQREGESRGSRFYVISGQVERGKKVRVLGSDVDHLVVLVRTRGGARMPIDLGPISDLRGTYVRSGDRIKAQGALGRIGERQVLMAHRFITEDGETIRVDRHRHRVGGRVEETTTARVKGTDQENLLARVKTDDGRRMVVDLGTVESVKDLNLRKGDRISVRGAIVRVEDTPIVMARQLRYEDEVIQVSRTTGAQKPLRDAIQAARDAVRAEEQGQLVKHAEQALIHVGQAQRSGEERISEAVGALHDAIEHGRKGETEDAREHVQHAIMRLSQAAGTQVPEGFRAGEPQRRHTVAEEAKPSVNEAIQHAKKAEEAARAQEADNVRKHAEKAISKVKDAQRHGLNERLTEGAYQLGDAIEHAKKGDLKDAQEHLRVALKKLSQAESAAGQQTAQQGKEGGTRTIKGDIIVKGEVLEIDRDGFYVVRDRSGNEVRMIVSEGLQPNIRVGDTVKAEVQPDGRVRSIEKATESSRR